MNRVIVVFLMTSTELSKPTWPVEKPSALARTSLLQWVLVCVFAPLVVLKRAVAGVVVREPHRPSSTLNSRVERFNDIGIDHNLANSLRVIDTAVPHHKSIADSVERSGRTYASIRKGVPRPDLTETLGTR